MPSSNHQQTFGSQIYTTNTTLLLGFTLLLALLALQITLSTSEMESQRIHMEQILKDKLEKDKLTQTMLNSAQKRGDILMQIYYEDDPFKLDEMAIEFSKLAGNFMAARNKLVKLDLSPQEFEAQENARMESGKGTEIFNQVFELALSDEWMSEAVREEAFYLLTEEAIPACQQARMSIEEIHRITKESGQYAIDKAQHDFEETRSLLWALGLVTFLLSAAIVWSVYRRVSSSSRQLQKIHEQMARQIRETVTMFNVSVALIEHSMSGGDDSIRQTIDQLTARSGMIREVRSKLQQIEQRYSENGTENHKISEEEKEINADCDAMDQTLNDAITTFQDFDRVSQQLVQVGNSLNTTAMLLNDPDRINNPKEWEAVHQQMRSTFVMPDAQLLYEEMVSGTDKQTALKLARELKQQSKDSFELF